MFRKEFPCRRLLREQFKNGRLDAATSKAEVLEELCDKLNFDPDAAAALHKQLYREKLLSVVADKKISGEQTIPSCMRLYMRPLFIMSERRLKHTLAQKAGIRLPKIVYLAMAAHIVRKRQVLGCPERQVKDEVCGGRLPDVRLVCAEEDANELDRLRRLLCIPREDVDKVNKEICGRIYQDVSSPSPAMYCKMLAYYIHILLSVPGRASGTKALHTLHMQYNVTA